MLFFRVKSHSSLFHGFISELTHNLEKRHMCIISGYDREMSRVAKGTVLYVTPDLNTEAGNRLYQNYTCRLTTSLTFNSGKIKVHLVPVVPYSYEDDDDADADIDELLNDVEISRREYEAATQTTTTSSHH